MKNDLVTCIVQMNGIRCDAPFDDRTTDQRRLST
jgi:hypothetical protein